MDWTDLAQEEGRWRTPGSVVMNLGFHKLLESSYVAAQLAASPEVFSSMELVR
jgi:hypothetical protein